MLQVTLRIITSVAIMLVFGIITSFEVWLESVTLSSPLWTIELIISTSNELGGMVIRPCVP